MNLKRLNGNKSRRVSDDYTYPSEWDDEFKYDENNGLYHYTMAAVELKGGYRSKYKTGGYADTIEECTEQAKIDAEEMYNKWKDFSDWIQGVSKVDVEIRDNEKNSILNYFYLTEDKDGSMYMSKGWVNDSRRIKDGSESFAITLSSQGGTAKTYYTKVVEDWYSSNLEECKMKAFDEAVEYYNEIVAQGETLDCVWAEIFYNGSAYEQDDRELCTIQVYLNEYTNEFEMDDDF